MQDIAENSDANTSKNISAHCKNTCYIPNIREQMHYEKDKIVFNYWYCAVHVDWGCSVFVSI